MNLTTNIAAEMVALQKPSIELDSAARTRRPRVLVIVPAFIPSTQMYTVKPILALHRAGKISAEIALEYTISARSLQDADVLVLCRNTEPAYDWILDFALRENKPLLYELDDNFFEISPITAVGRYHRAPERLTQLSRYLRGASLVRVHSEEMRERVLKLNPNVERVVGPVDWKLIPQHSAANHSGKLRIVYATSRTEDELANLFLKDLGRLLERYSNRIEVYFWGYHPPEMRGHLSVQFLPFIRNYDAYFRRFAEFSFDIGLAPLLGEAFYRSKSNVKFREYAACGVAGVYSKVKPYIECVEHEVTGLLVENQREGWMAAVGRLIENEQLRRSIQKNAREFSRKHYDAELFQEVLWEQIQATLAGAKQDRQTARDNVAVPHRRDGGSKGLRSDGSSNQLRTECRWAGRYLGWGSKFLRALGTHTLSHTLDSIHARLSDLAFLVRIRMKLFGWSPRGH